jgi:hypothetical protein
MQRQQKITLGEMRQSGLADCRSFAATTNALTRSSSMPISGAMMYGCPTWSRNSPVRFAGTAAPISGPLFERAKMGTEAG